MGEAAKALKINRTTLQRWIVAGKVKAPPLVIQGNQAARLWSKDEVAKLRQLLPRLRYKATNGRSIRRSRKRPNS